jgi:hypothetical protein
MQAKLSVALSEKDASRLLKGLAKDPQLRADDDPSVLVEEQFPSEHHAMLQGKTEGSSSNNIITILRWEKHHSPHLAEEQKAMLTEQKNRTKMLFQFTATTTNPWDDVQFVCNTLIEIRKIWFTRYISFKGDSSIFICHERQIEAKVAQSCF